MATQTKKKGRPWGHGLRFVALGLSGAALLYLTTQVNYSGGYKLGATPQEAQLYAYMSLAVDIVGVAILGLYAGYLFGGGKRLAGWCCSGLVAGFMVYSMVMFYGFGAANRVVPEQMAHQRYLNELAAHEKTEAARVADKDKHVSFLQDEVRRATDKATSKSLTRSERKDARAAQQNVIDGSSQMAFGTTITFEAAPVAEITDPQAKVIADDTGLSVNMVQKLLTGFLGVLLILAKAMCFGYAGKEWAEAVAMSRVEAETNEEPVPVAAVPVAVEPEPKPVAIPRTRTVIQALPEPDLFAGDPDLEQERREDVERLGRELVDSIAEHRSDERLVEEFISLGCDRVPGERIQAMHFYAAFKDWTRERGYACPNYNVFGRAMTALNRYGAIDVPRDTTGGRFIYYVGVQPKGSAGDARAAA
jgi:hypothetical protein